MTVVNAQYVGILQTKESFTIPVSDAASSALVDNVTNSLWTKEATLTPISVPDGEIVVNKQYTLVAGAITVDFTALPQAGGAANYNATTPDPKKIRMFKFQAPTTNTANIRIVTGAATGKTICGAAFQCTIPPGGEVQGYLLDGDVAASASLKLFDVTGTGTEKLNVTLVLG